MAASPSSSSPSSENEAKLHPYQEEDMSSPKGAFEAKKVQDLLYIRVDMPGVPNDCVKVVKYNDTRTVTFNGKAPKSSEQWAHPFDTSDRVYGGYVVIDRDPADVDIKFELKNGCLRLLFPNCDGSLHFLKTTNSNNTNLDQHDTAQDVEDKIPAEPIISFIQHAPQESAGIKLMGGKPEDINPFQLSGVRGVYEHKAVKDEGGTEVVYVRLDMPGIPNIGYSVMENFDRALIFAGIGHQDSEFDEGAREYFGALTPACPCCKYEVVKHEMKDGVLRFLARKTQYLRLNETPVVAHVVLPASRPGGPLQPSAIPVQMVDGKMPPTFGFR